MRGASLCLCLLLLVTWATAAHARRKCRRKRDWRRCERRAALRGQAVPAAMREGSAGIASVMGDQADAGTITVTKVQAPRWRRHPPRDQMIIMRQGSDAVFRCKATGKPGPNVTWTKDKEAIRVKRSEDKYQKNKWKLVVRNVMAGDGGNYTCQIENKAGKLHWTFSLRVLANQPISEISIAARPEDQTAQVGDTVTFECKSHTWPPPEVYWTRRPDQSLLKEIMRPENLNYTLDEVLVVENVTKADAGLYTCYIGNEHASVTLSARLDVIEEGERLPWEPRCALHVRKQVLVDDTWGCVTDGPVDTTYCMGSCGRSYYIPTLTTTSSSHMQERSLNQTCQCCRGITRGIMVVNLLCPEGGTRQGFYKTLQECRCQSCDSKSELLSLSREDLPMSPP